MVPRTEPRTPNPGSRTRQVAIGNAREQGCRLGESITGSIAVGEAYERVLLAAAPQPERDPGVGAQAPPEVELLFQPSRGRPGGVLSGSDAHRGGSLQDRDDRHWPLL